MDTETVGTDRSVPEPGDLGGYCSRSETHAASAVSIFRVI
jgi:hypothetical protein